jgi:GNAT superfamily N-acetyltransferase
MDHRAALAAFDEQLRRDPRPSIAGGRFERIGDVVRCIGPDGGWTGVIWADLDEASADAVIADQVRYFTALGRSFEWKYYSYDRPADLPDRLRRAGLEPEPEEALMVADLRELPLDLAPPEGVRLVPVTDADGIRQLVRVGDEAFGGDHSAAGQALLTRLLAAPESVTPILAMAGDRPVCGARIEFHEGTEFASLWGGGTVESWRGKGIYRSMVSHRARLAAARGFRYLTVDAMPASRPILERLGFVRLTSTAPYTFTPR